MNLDKRIRLLEAKVEIKKPGCNISLFIVVPEEHLSMPENINSYQPFDSDSYKPNDAKMGKYLKQLKDSGQCRDCKGSCAIDWDANGFKNHTLTGESNSSTPEPKIFTMYCADAEIPALTRRIMNGERTQ